MHRILISGPIFDTPTGPSGQGGKLYNKLKNEGFIVYKRSKYRNPIFRVIDTLLFVILSARKYDIILIQMFSNKAFIVDFFVINIAKLLNKKVICTIRGGAFIEFYNKFPRLISYTLKKSNHITSPSHFIGKFLILKGINVHYIPNFIEVDNFPYLWSLSNTKSILWVRAFTDIYKPEFAIMSIKMLIEDYPNINLTMVGPDQGKMASCQNLIKKLGLSNNINIVGVVPNTKLIDFYSKHSIYINTTSYESFGVALVEAACSGIPVVTTDVGEIPYLWKNKDEMLIVKDNDLETFVKCILNLLKDEQLSLNLSKNARKKAENFSWQNVSKNWVDLIEN